jgi:hypothetical protein
MFPGWGLVGVCGFGAVFWLRGLLPDSTLTFFGGPLAAAAAAGDVDGASFGATLPASSVFDDFLFLADRRVFFFSLATSDSGFGSFGVAATPLTWFVTEPDFVVSASDLPFFISIPGTGSSFASSAFPLLSGFLFLFRFLLFFFFSPTTCRQYYKTTVNNILTKKLKYLLLVKLFNLLRCFLLRLRDELKPLTPAYLINIRLG